MEEAMAVEGRETGPAAWRRWCRPARWSNSQTGTLDLDLEKIQFYHLLNWAFVSNTQFMLRSVQLGEAQTLRGGSSNAKSW